MLRIGEFAGLTGLSVKALRHYDDEGVLVPDGIDESSGYRWYGEGQVRAGVVARLLRDAGVPLPAVARALTTDSAAEALSAHRQRVLDERAAEDRTFAEASSGLVVLEAPVSVVERLRQEQPFVGQVLSVRADEAESLTDDDANGAFAVLLSRVKSRGIGPSGRLWTTIRAGARGVIEVVCCAPTWAEVEEDWCTPGSVAGVLPARTELVVVWRPSMNAPVPENAMHPAAVALFDATAERGVEVRGAEIRQEVIGESEDDYVVELSVTI